MKRRRHHFGILSTSESWITMLIWLLNSIYFRQEVLAEDETEESDSDEKNEMQRKISYEEQHNGSISRDSRNMSLIDSKLPSRKTSAMNSAATANLLLLLLRRQQRQSTNCPLKTWLHFPPYRLASCNCSTQSQALYLLLHFIITCSLLNHS